MCPISIKVFGQTMLARDVYIYYYKNNTKEMIKWLV